MCNEPLTFLSRGLGRLRDLVSWVVLLVALGITGFAWREETAGEADRVQAVLDQRAALVGEALQERVGRYERLLAAARGALAGVDREGEETLHRFIRFQELPRHFPGIDGFGLIVPVPPEKYDDFLAARRASQPDFRVYPSPARPDGEARETYVIIQAEPESALQVMGYDIASDPERRRVAERARDDGAVVSSGRVTLLSPGASGNDLVLMAAVYHGGAVPSTVEERRAALAGWVVAGVRLDRIIGPIFSLHPGVGVVITDTTATGAADPGAQPGDMLYAAGARPDARPAPLLTRTMSVHVAGRTWELRFQSLPADGPGGEYDLPRLILMGGAGLSVLLWATVHLLATGRGQALAEADRAAAALLHAEAKYHRFIDATAEGYFEADADGRIVDVNDALCRILGTPRETLEGASLLDLTSGSSRAVMARQLTVRADGDQRCYELALRAAGGGLVHLRVNATSATDPASGRLHSFALLTDVTAQKRVQDEMRAAQERLEQIFAASPVAMAVVRLEDGTVLQANRSAADLFGVATVGDGLIGCNLFPFIMSLDDRQHLFGTVRASGGVHGFEMRMMRPDGSSWWGMLSAARFLHDGELAMLVGCQNIDAVKQGQEAQRLATAILDSVRDGVMVMSLDHRIQQVNPAFSWITGYEAFEAIGNTPAILDSGRQDSVVYDEVWRTVEQDGFWQGDLWHRRRSGEVFVSSTTVVPIQAGGETVTHYVAVMHDITSRKEDEDRNWRLANYDPLTGLPNRLLFADRLSQAVGRAQRTGGRFALLYLDLDGFKPINDRWGHGAGDQVLQETAQRLQACVRGSDTVARLGGDEFVVILADSQDRAGTQAVAEKIVAALARPVTIATVRAGRNEQVQGAVTVSIGMALFAADGNSSDSMIDAADAAMYHAKQSGKNRCTFPPPDRPPDRPLDRQGIREGSEKPEGLHLPAQGAGTGEMMGSHAERAGGVDVGA